MSRPSAAIDAARWPATVCAWVDREQRRRAAKRKPDAPTRRHTEATRSRYFSRFLFDLDAIIEHATAGSVRHAWQIARMYREANRAGWDRDPAAAKFLRRIRPYMEDARQLYASDARRSVAKALRVVTANRGRRPRAEGGRDVTDDMLAEALMIYDEALAARDSEKYAVGITVEKTCIGESAIRDAVRRRTL